MKRKVIKLMVNLLAKSDSLCKLFKAVIVKKDNDMNADIETNGELHFIKYLKNIIPKETVVFDIGANKGEYSKLLQTNLQTQNIYTFDPLEENITRTKENTGNKLKYITNAVSDFDGKIDFFIDTAVENSGHSSLYDMNSIGYKTKSEIREVDVCKLDTFVNENNIHKVNFIKIDIEGNELKALRGGENMFINKQVDIVQFEFGHASRASRTLLIDFVNFFKEYNFELFSVMPTSLKKLNYTPFVENKWHIINIVAIKKDLIFKFNEIIEK